MSDETYGRPGERAWRDPVLVAVFAVGLGLRVAGLSHALPDVYNPDEVSILSRALGLGSGDLNPHNFLYPSLFFYVLAAATGVLAGFQWAIGQVSSLGAFEARFWQDPSPVYLAARLLVALAGALTVPATYAVARRVGGIQVARVAATLMAVAYVPVRDAHVVKHDVPATLLILLAVLASWRVWKSGRVLDYLLAGVSAGVAASFHYYGVYAVVPIVAAHGLRSGVTPGAWLAPRGHPRASRPSPTSGASPSSRSRSRASTPWERPPGPRSRPPRRKCSSPLLRRRRSRASTWPGRSLRIVCVAVTTAW